MNNPGKTNVDKMKRGVSNLFMASASLDDPKRIEAFGSLYSMMQIVDDLADSLVDKPDLTNVEHEMVLKDINNWKERVEFCYSLGDDTSRTDLSLLKAISKFNIPSFLWDDFFSAASMDLNTEGFESMETLEQYAKGTAVVPFTFFLIMIISEPDNYGVYRIQIEDDLFKVGRSLGYWSYILHTLVIEKAYLKGTPSRNLLPLDLMTKHSVTFEMLKEQSRSESVDSNTSEMLSDYVSLAEEKGRLGRQFARRVVLQLSSGRQKALSILVSIYTEIQKRIRQRGYNIFTDDPLWTSADRAELINRIEGCHSKQDLMDLL
jgi:phytoene/squalene synthetase